MISKMHSQVLHFIERRALGLALLVVLVCFLLIAGMGIWIAISEIPNVRGDESYVIFSIQKVMSGKPLYTDPTVIPFDYTQYSPLYYYLCAGIAKAIGIVPGEVHEVYVAARSVSLVCSACWVIICYVILTRLLATNRTLALIACGFIYVCASPWNFLARPDCLTSLCIIASMYCFLKSASSDEKASPFSFSLCLAAIFGVAAVFTKQSGTQMPFVILSFLVIARNWKRLAVATVATIIPLILLLAFSDFLFGPAMKQNIVDGLRVGVDLRFAFRKAYYIFFSQMSIVVAISGMAFLEWTRPESSAQKKFLAYVMLVFFSFATLTAMKLGSAIHYYIEFQTIAFISSAYFLSPGLKSAGVDITRNSRCRLVLFLYTFLFMPTFCADQLGYFRAHRQEAYGALDVRKEVIDFIQAELGSKPGTYFFAWDGHINNSMPDHCVMPHKSLVRVISTREVLDFAGFAECVANGKVRYIICDKGELPSGFIGVGFENFRHLKDIGNYSIYAFYK